MLLVVLMLVLRWVLGPVKRLISKLKEIEAGEKDQMEGSYPAELVPLSASLNTLFRHERYRQTRYRKAMDDLAHSLKTPLAVFRELVEKNESAKEHIKHLSEHVTVMGWIVDYKLQKQQPPPDDCLNSHNHYILK